jgi:hypothetical protein
MKECCTFQGCSQPDQASFKLCSSHSQKVVSDTEDFTTNLGGLMDRLNLMLREDE